MAILMVSSQGNGAIALLVLAAALFASVFVPTSSADGTLILGAVPIYDPSTNESANLTFTVYLVSNITARVQWFVDGIRENATDTAFVYRPDYNAAGVHNITVIVNSTTITDSHRWTVTVINKDEPFYISGYDPAGDVKLSAGSSQLFTVNISNPDSDPLVIQWFVNGAMMAGENRTIYKFIAGTNLSGAMNISAFISDGVTSRTLQWNVAVSLPMIVVPTGIVRLTEGENQTFRVMDKGAQAVSWALDGASLNVNTPAFNYAAGYSSQGTHTLTVSCSDGTVYSWTVLVANFNQAPVLPDGRIITTFVGDSTPIKATVYDVDGTVTRFQWDIDADGDNDFESVTTPNFTYKFDKPGEWKAILRVSDNEGAVSSTIYIFDVQEKTARFNWWIPAIFVGIFALLLLLIVVVQRRRISRLRDEQDRKKFYTTKAAPVEDEDKPGFRDSSPTPQKTEPEVWKEEKMDAGTPGGETKPENPPDVQQAEEEPELLQVKPKMGDKGMDAELKHEDEHGTEVAMKKKDEPAAEAARRESGKKGAGKGKPDELDDIISTLLDKGAESETGASDTELHGSPTRAKKEKADKSPEPPAASGLKDKRAEGEVVTDEAGHVHQKKKSK